MELVRIDAPLPLRLRQVNLYLIHGSAGWALVDTGVASAGGREAIRAQLAQQGLEPSQLRQVFVTHHHIDHWGLASWFQTFGAQLIMPRLDHDNLWHFFFEADFERATVDFFRPHGLCGPDLTQIRAALAQARTLCAPFRADLLVDDGDRVELAGERFEVLVTPGHSMGHACLHHARSGTLLAGDHVLPHITPNISISIDTLPDPLSAYRRSLARLRGRGDRRVLPAHGPEIADLDRRVTEILRHHDEREALLLSLLGPSPQTCFELAQGLFDIDGRDGWQTWMATGETLAHLKTLESAGKVQGLRRGDTRLFRRA